MGPNQLFIICVWLYVFDGVFDNGWYEFQLKYWCLCTFFKIFYLFIYLFIYFFAIIKCQILLQGISDATNIVIHQAVTTEKSEKKFLNSVSRFGFWPFKMIKINKFLWKKEKLQKHELLYKRKVHSINKKRVYEFSS